MSPKSKIEPWFKIERDAAAEIDSVRTAGDWKRLATTLDTLCEARQSIAECAKNGGAVRVLDSMEVADAIEKGGRYLITPPLVARDASIIDHSLRSRGIAAVVLCREPKTKLDLCPVVALGSGITIRTQVKEPSNPQKPTVKWFDQALDGLGDAAVDRIDVTNSPQRQLNYLLAHLPAIPMHRGVYREAITLCHALLDQSV